MEFCISNITPGDILMSRRTKSLYVIISVLPRASFTCFCYEDLFNTFTFNKFDIDVNDIFSKKYWKRL